MIRGCIRGRIVSRHCGTCSPSPFFRRIELSTIGSYGGEATALVAFSVLAYRVGGVGGIALLVAVQMLPAAALVPSLSRFAERARREQSLGLAGGVI